MVSRIVVFFQKTEFLNRPRRNAISLNISPTELNMDISQFKNEGKEHVSPHSG